MAVVSDAEKTATAAYIKSMLGDLSAMSHKIDCSVLVYLLEMAMMEAAEIERGAYLKGNQAAVSAKKATPADAKQLAELYMAGQLEA